MIVSVLMSVYQKDNAQFLQQALESVVTQTRTPDEIVLIIDGPIDNELKEVVETYKNKYVDLFKIYPLQSNIGLGKALNIGLGYCSGDLVARMDADDISKPDRFALQLAAFNSNPNLSILGTSMDEFIHEPGDVNQKRILPQTHANILKWSKKRNPFNHPTVMFKKQAVLSVGSYEDIPLFEDYFLWLKLLNNNFVAGNLFDSLLYFRTGNQMIKRRHGISYFRKEIYFFSKSYQNNYISKADFVKAMILRVPLRLLPLWSLQLVYKFVLRK